MFSPRRLFVTARLALGAAVLFAVPFGALSPLARADDSCVPAHSDGTMVSIHLSDDQLPASDLYCDANCLAQLHQSGEPHVLSPEEAWADKTQYGLDLSKLNPDPTTDEWKGPSTSSDEALDAELPIQNWDWVNYLSDICSSSGRYRFNVRTLGSVGQPAQTLTLMISRNLHAFLLRKELLRRLGYKIPPIKFLPYVKVRFPDRIVKAGGSNKKLIEAVLTNWLPDAADGAAKRWCSMAKSVDPVVQVLNGKKDYLCTPVPDSELGGDPDSVILQDVVAMQATPVYYDLALGPPIQRIPGTTQLRPEGLRIIRALSLAYGLLDIPESVNEFDWYAAHEQNGAITLHVPDQANFATTMDDAKWIMRKIAALTRDDFTQIVANADYPAPIARVIVEKLVARRNSLVSMFGMKVRALPFDPKVSDPPAVKSGKVIQQNWPGYASRFAEGDAQSPLKGLQWYLLSELQANAMEALMNKVNNAIPSLNEQDAYSQHGKDLMQKALEQYLKTGQVQKIPFGAWVAPLLSGSVQISRDVVLGQYLGTDNLVQLADTFGFTANVGLMVGFDALPAAVQLSGMVQGSLNISLTHLKPLNSLKESVTYPLEKEIVAWVFRDASQAFQQIADSQDPHAKLNDPTVVKAINNKLAEDVDKLKQYLDVGESLILTESVSGDQELAAGFQPPMSSHHNVLPAFGPKVDLNEIVLSRLHFYRKDQNTILVFQDNGELVGPTFSAEFTLGQTVPFPVLSLTAKRVAGHARTKVFTLNITPDVSSNPGIYGYAGGLASALRSGSTEVLEQQMHVQPMQVSVGFHDSSSSFQFFHWMRRSLKSNGQIQVTLPDGTTGNYISLTDGAQTGKHYQSLGTEAASYILQRLTNNTNYAIDTQANPNPGQSFFGHSQTRDAGFEAEVDNNNLVDPYVRVNYRWEGWNLSAKDAKALVDSINTKYGVKFYDDGFLGTTTNIKMYEVLLAMNVYQAGIQQVLSMSKADEKALVGKYRALHDCNDYDEGYFYPLSGSDEHDCARLESFQGELDEYREHDDNPDKTAQQILQIVSDLEQFTSFQDFVHLLGGANNPDGKPRIYIASQITGFREGTEPDQIMNPIQSTRTFGFADKYNPSGVVDSVQNLLGIEDGEFNMKWLRDVL